MKVELELGGHRPGHPLPVALSPASALLFAAEGARVTVTCRDRGRQVVAAAGGTAIFARADASRPLQWS